MDDVEVFVEGVQQRLEDSFEIQSTYFDPDNQLASTFKLESNASTLLAQLDQNESVEVLLAEQGFQQEAKHKSGIVESALFGDEEEEDEEEELTEVFEDAQITGYQTKSDSEMV